MPGPAGAAAAPRDAVDTAGRANGPWRSLRGGQGGRRFLPGLNVGLGKDDTLFAKVAGRVRYEDHGARGRKISILPVE